MKCEYCGKILSVGNKFCDECGAKVDNNTNQNSIESSNMVANQKVELKQDTKLENSLNNNSETGQSNVNFPRPKKSKTGLIIFLIILIVGVLVAAGFGGYYYSQSNSDNDQEENKTEDKKDKEDNKDDDNKEESKTSEVYFAGSTFSIPKNIKYEISGNQLYLSSGVWFAAIQESPYSYQVISSIKDNYIDALKVQGLNATSYEEKKIGNFKYLIYNIENDNLKMLMAFREYTTSSTLLVGISNSTNTDAKTIWLEEIDKILSTAEMNSINRDLINDKVDLNQYNDIINSIN